MNEIIRQLAGPTQEAAFTDFLGEVDRAMPAMRTALQAHYSEKAAQLLSLKIANLLTARYEYRHAHVRLLARPFGLIIDPANHCNLHCPGCVHSNSARVKDIQFDWPAGLMKEDTFIRLLDRFIPYSIQIAFYNNGEPFLNPAATDYIRRARQYLVMTTTSSNISHTKINAAAIVASGLDFMTLSMDGGTAEVYSLFRRGGDFGLAMQNIRALVAEKKRQHRRTPTLAWQFLVFRHNRHERELVRKLSLEIGVNLLIYAKPMSVSWDDPSVADDETLTNPYEVISLDDLRSQSLRHRLTERLKQLIPSCKAAESEPEIEQQAQQADATRLNALCAESWTERARQAGLSATDPGAPAPRKRCAWLYKSMTIDALGRVLPCCRAPSMDVNLLFSDISQPDPYNAPGFLRSRHYFIHGRRDDEPCPPFCWTCPHSEQGVLTGNHHIRVFLERFDVRRALSPESITALSDW